MELDLSECDIYFDNDASDVDYSDQDDPSGGPAGAGVPSSNGTSLQSSSMRTTFEELLVTGAAAAAAAAPPPKAAPAARPPFWFDAPGDDDCAPRSLSQTAMGMPVRASAVAMCSSVPIAIPSLSRWPAKAAAAGTAGSGQLAGGAGAGAGAAARPAFVPPHQLIGKDDFLMTASGASPSACLKRERLRTRNAILRVTGFLESS